MSGSMSDIRDPTTGGLYQPHGRVTPATAMADTYQLHADDEGWLGSSEVQDWNPRLRPFLKNKRCCGLGSMLVPRDALPCWTDPSPLPSSEVHGRCTDLGQAGTQATLGPETPRRWGPLLLGLAAVQTQVAFPKEEGSGQWPLLVPWDRARGGVSNPCGTEAFPGVLGLTHLRVLVAIEAFPDLVLVHVTEGNHLGGHRTPASGTGDPGGQSCWAGWRGAHLASCPGRQAAVKPAALPARVPDGESCPVRQDPFFQEADTVGPDGGPGGGVGRVNQVGRASSCAQTFLPTQPWAQQGMFWGPPLSRAHEVLA